MVLDKEARREYQKRYRLKKAAPGMVEFATATVPDRLEAVKAFSTETINPVVLQMIAKLEKRVAALEAKKADAGLKKLDAEAGEDLFKRVMREKESRLKKP